MDEKCLTLSTEEWRAACASKRTASDDNWGSVIGWMMIVIIFASAVLASDTARERVMANDKPEPIMCEMPSGASR